MINDIHGTAKRWICYVCDQPVLADDIPAYKGEGVRHFWHMVPGEDYVQGVVRYAMALADAKTWAEAKLADGFKAPEQHEQYQKLLAEVNRLQAKESN